MSKNELEFANVVCKMGAKNLLDIAEEFLLPVFFDEHEARTWGKGDNATKWFFLDASLESFNDSDFGVFFQFVKQKKLKSEQFLNPGRQLVTQTRELDDAPSALGLLILNTHRLVYLPKTSSAPSLNELKLTIETLLRRKHEQKLMALMNNVLRGQRTAAKKSFLESYPPPTCEIIQLSSEEKLRSAISRYEQINSFSVQIVEPNPSDYEAGDELFMMLREARKGAHAHTTSLVHRSSEGLDPQFVEKQAEIAGTDMNTKVVIKGIDEDGVKITQTNESLGLKVQATFDPNDPKVWRHMYDELQSVETSFALGQASRGDEGDGARRTPVEHLRQAFMKAKEIFYRWTSRQP